MQSGGQSAGIQLQVGLDLAFFRQQLTTLGAATTGYKLPINIKFDRLSIQNELNTLGTNIKKRNYFLEVKTNLAAEIKNANDLATALDNLARSQQAAKAGIGQQLGVGAIGRAPKEGGLGSQDVKKLYRASANAGLLAFDKEIAKTKASMVAAMEVIGVDAIAGLLNGLSSQDARLQAAAKYLGEGLIKTTKASLGIASPSKEFEKIGKNVGEGFEKGALSSMDNAFDALEGKMRQRGKILDTVARGIFRMLGIDPAAMLQQAREQRATPVRTPIAGLLPAYTPRGTREETIRQLTEGGPSVAQGPGMLALSNEALGRRVSSILQEYFKVAEVQVRESFDPRELKQSLNVFSYIAQSLRDAESRTKQARVAESVDFLMQSIDNAVRIAQARVRVSRVQVSELGPMAQTALPAGRVAGLLPGRPSQASVLELNNILAGAIREYFAAVVRGIKPSAGLQGRPLLGPGSTVAGLLPPAGGTTPRGAVRFNTVTTGGTYGPAEPPRFAAPSLPPPSESPGYLGGRTGSSVRTRTPGGFIGGGIPSGGGTEATAFVNASKNALAYSQALGRLRESLKEVRAGQLPLVGSIKELAGEFGQATKQVLLYGTAYKALAFLTSLPGEAFNAAKALGTYKNQLQAVTAETGTFSTSLAFVDGLAQRFNVPLESARQGFVKLYASMQPAGFNQEQIEGLFTGISQSAAAFGLSADKVDRVNYAFAQMASKGQIMSEELKGQLGDVLPGALALFAEAAKMSIPEFSKAMEDGRFKGDAMVQVLENVGILMKVKFGAAAQGAAKTLQGALNGIQNNLKLMYEALGPVVNRMAAVFGPSVTSLIKSATDVIKAFELGISTTGDSFAAMSPQAQNFYASIQSILPSIESLVPSFVAAAQNIGYFAASLATTSQPLLGLWKLALDFISIPFVARVGVYATIIGVLTSAFTLLKNTGIIQTTIAMIRFIATLTVGQVQAWIASIQAAIAALVAMARTANIARLGLMALKVTLVSFGVGAVLLGLDFVAQRLLNIGAAADDAKKRAAALTDELARAVETGNVALVSAKYVEEETKAQSLGKSKQILERFQGGFQQGASMTKQEYEQLQRTGLATGINFNERKGRATATSGQVAENLKTARTGYVEALNASGSAKEALRDSIQVQGNMQRQLQASRSQMKDIPSGTTGGGSTGETQEASRINQLLQENLRLSNEKGIIGKDELTQLELKVKLAQAIFVLEEEEIKLTMKGREQQIALNNATLAYQVIVGKANDDWAEATQKIEDIGLQVTEITDKILGQQTPDQSPLQKALSGLKKEAIDNVQVLEKLRKSIRALAGDRPEGKTAIAGIKQAFSLINTQDPLLTASKRVTGDIVKDLKSELKELNTSGQSVKTLDKVILKLGDDWKSLSPQIKSDLTELAGQIDAAKPFAEIASALRRSREELAKMTSTSTLVISSANSIGDAFGTAFKGVITGSMSAREALAGFFQSLADSFADMVAKMIAEYLKMQLIKGIMSLIPGLGSFGGGANIGQSVAMPTGVGIGAGGGILQNSAAQGFGTLGPNFGIRQFANGGIVTGPTLGLVGEGRYNEAVIPLPDGKSVPVQLSGGDGGSQISSNIVVNVNNGQAQSNATGSNSSELGRKIEGAVKQVIVGELRPGGLLASR